MSEEGRQFVKRAKENMKLRHRDIEVGSLRSGSFRQRAVRAEGELSAAPGWQLLKKGSELC